MIYSQFREFFENCCGKKFSRIAIFETFGGTLFSRIAIFEKFGGLYFRELEVIREKKFLRKFLPLTLLVKGWSDPMIREGGDIPLSKTVINRPHAKPWPMGID